MPASLNASLNGAAMRKRVFALAVSSVILFSTTWAQEPPKSATAETPKFSSQTQLVLVPVVVTGKDGKHVTGLGREAFRVEERGKLRVPTIFEEVATKPAAAQPMPEGVRTNFDAGGRKLRVTAVMLDLLNTPFLKQAEAKKHLVEYLSKSLVREEPTALFGLRRDGLHQLYPFTRDPQVLVTALKKLQGQMGQDEINLGQSSAMNDTTDTMQASSNAVVQQVGQFLADAESLANAAQQRTSIRTTLEAMRAIAHAYEGIPGRKTLIWASAGFPFMIDDPQAFAHMGNDMVQEYEETWRALSASGVAVYTVDVTGLTAFKGNLSGMDAANGASGAQRTTRASRAMTSNTPARIEYDRDAERQEALKAFASATGGLACLNTNDLEKCFAQAVEDSRSYYMLGYYLPADDQQPGWRKLKVKVAVDGAHVRAREGFYVTAPEENSKEAQKKQLMEAVESPVEYTGVRLTAREVAPGENSKNRHDFVVAVVGDSLTVNQGDGNAVDLTVLGVAFDANGKSVAQKDNHLAAKLKPEMLARVKSSGLAMKLGMELAPGEYSIRFVVRDNINGQVGSVEYPVVAK